MYQKFCVRSDRVTDLIEHAFSFYGTVPNHFSKSLLPSLTPFLGVATAYVLMPRSHGVIFSFAPCQVQMKLLTMRTYCAYF